MWLKSHRLLKICSLLILLYAPLSFSEQAPSTPPSTDTQKAIKSGALLYVTDALTTALRAGGGTEYRIIAFLKSGTALRPSTPTDNGGSTKGWSSVTTMNGTAGWVETEHLSTTPSAQNQLINLNQKFATLNRDYSDAKKTLSESTTTIKQLESDKRDLTQKLIAKQSEYQRLKAISEKSIQIDEDNKRLNQELSLLRVQLEELGIENGQLKDSKYIDGLTHGTFAVVIGCLLALVLPRLGGMKKRSNGWD